MKFLHEYFKHNDGTIYDNGWWEIDGNRLYNINGGWHDYNPSSDDIIIEADGWDDIPMDYLLDDEAITGWIAPDGKFYGCNPEEHMLIAEKVLKSSESMLENQGYVKIYMNPGYLIYAMKQKGYNISTYEFLSTKGHITEAQRVTLEHKGFDVENGKYLEISNKV